MIIESYTVILSNNMQNIIHFSSGISTLKREYSKIVQTRQSSHFVRQLD